MKPRLSFLIATAAILCIAWVSTRGLDALSPWAELAIYGYNLFAAIAIYAVVETLPPLGNGGATDEARGA